MIKTIVLDAAAEAFTRECRVPDISDLRGRQGKAIWANVSDPTGQDVLTVEEQHVSWAEQYRWSVLDFLDGGEG